MNDCRLGPASPGPPTPSQHHRLVSRIRRAPRLETYVNKLTFELHFSMYRLYVGGIWKRMGDPSCDPAWMHVHCSSNNVAQEVDAGVGNDDDQQKHDA